MKNLETLNSVIKALNESKSKIDDVDEAYDYIVANNNIEGAKEELMEQYGKDDDDTLRHLVITAAMGY